MGKLLILKYAEIDSKRLKYRTELHQSYALVKLFCPHPPSRGSPGVRGKMLVIKKGGSLEKGKISDYKGRGKENIK